MAAPIVLAALAAALIAAAGGTGQHFSNKRYNEEVLDEAVQAVRNSQYANSVSGLSDREVRSIIESNYVDKEANLHSLFGLSDGGMSTIDTDSLLQELANVYTFNELQPVAPDAEQLLQDAKDSIAKENAEILALYDADLQRRTDLFNQQMSDNNAAYNRNVNQVLSNDYQKNAQLLGTMRSEMNRAQRNALEAGASAGLRIAGNINTMLSVQNKQSQQSLETSNNLAQMLLNQQQANAGLTSDYSNYLSQDTANRANLKHGTAERVNAMYDQNKSVADSIYDSKMRDYEDRYSATVSATNPWREPKRASLYSSQYNN